MWFALDFQLYEQQKRGIDFRLQLRPTAERRLRQDAPWFYPASEVDEEPWEYPEDMQARDDLDAIRVGLWQDVGSVDTDQAAPPTTKL